MVLEAIKYTPESNQLEVLDQLRLPYSIHYEKITTCEQAHDCIKSMRVRGAPAIAMVAMLSLAVELKAMAAASEVLAGGAEKYIKQRLDYLTTSRPTAVNLADAARKMNAAVNRALASDESSQMQNPQIRLTNVVAHLAEAMLLEDVLTNKAIGKNGAEWITSKASSLTGPVTVLTHCNTGSLATAGYGTALGVVRALNESNSLRKAYCTETRPYNQGSRLTAFELVHDQIPACLITDSMASALLALKGATENIAAIVVGADRVAANGDTANKIGTYNLAITARFHGVKFVVAAPRTTIDTDTASGQQITIEQRPAKEMTTIRGPPVDSTGRVSDPEIAESVRIAAEGIDVWNPAFDVTPFTLIDAIVTEVGVAEKGPDGRFHLDRIMSHGVSNGT